MNDHIGQKLSHRALWILRAHTSKRPVDPLSLRQKREQVLVCLLQRDGISGVERDIARLVEHIFARIGDDADRALSKPGK